MTNLLGQFAQITLMTLSAFFAIWAFSCLFNLYLRHHDRLSIDREDVVAMARHAGNALLLGSGVVLYQILDFWAATAIVLSAIVAYQLLLVNGLIKHIENLPQKPQATDIQYYKIDQNQSKDATF